MTNQKIRLFGLLAGVAIFLLVANVSFIFLSRLENNGTLPSRGNAHVGKPADSRVISPNQVAPNEAIQVHPVAEASLGVLVRGVLRNNLVLSIAIALTAMCLLATVAYGMVRKKTPPLTVMAVVLLGWPVALYFVKIAERVNRMFGIWVTVLLVFILLSTVIFACLSIFSDPGRVAKNTAPRLLVEDDLKDGEELEYDKNGRLVLKKILKEDGSFECRKYCHTCQLWRPPRCSHCSFCDQCVLEFDHHCPWLSNCVGKGNYAWFVAFVTGLAVLCFAGSVVIGLLNLFEYMKDGVPLERKPWDSLILFLAVFFFLTFSLFSGFHLSLMFNGKTTDELVKQRNKSMV